MADRSVAVEILGKDYQVRCPVNRMQELQNAAVYVDKKMREIRDSGKVVGLDRIAIIAALNVAHELLHAGQQESDLISDFSERIASLQQKVEQTLIQCEQLELDEI